MGGLPVQQRPLGAPAHAVGLRERLRRLAGRAPQGQDDPAWLGSAVELDELERAAADGGMAVEHVENAGTQYCVVRLRKRS